MIDLSYKPDPKPEPEKWEAEHIAAAVIAVVLWTIIAILWVTA